MRARRPCASALQYRRLDPTQRDDVILKVVETIEKGDLRVVGTDDPQVWERGWSEVMRNIDVRPITIDALRPQYYRPGGMCRLLGDYVEPLTRHFDFHLAVAVWRILFSHFLQGRRRVVEFGCGTGLNLLLLAERFPDMRLLGCDWAAASQRIVQALSLQSGGRITAAPFNMLTLDGRDGVRLDRDTAVVTVGAMEQLGQAWGNFVAFLMDSKPGLCVHVEPLAELYDETRGIDALALQYHVKRNYLQGLLPHLDELARSGKAEILDVRRIQFGDLYHDGHSVLVWRAM